MWHLVVLVAAMLRHLVGLKHLLGKTFLSLLLLVQCVGVKASAELVVPVAERRVETLTLLVVFN